MNIQSANQRSTRTKVRTPQHSPVSGKLAMVGKFLFAAAAVAALFCIPHSALVLFSFLGVIDENTVFYQASYCLFYAIYLLFHIFFFLGASQVYRAGKAEKYASRAMSRLYMTAVYVVWAMMLLLFPSISNAAIGGALQIYKYVVLFFNALYFYDCFARITSREQQERELRELCAKMKKHHIVGVLEIGAGTTGFPMGVVRPHLLENDEMVPEGKADYAWHPEYDEDFRRFVGAIVREYGWPRGPVNGIKLWNEPWEGISISGWGADMLRYREMYKVMAEAAHRAGRIRFGRRRLQKETENLLVSPQLSRFVRQIEFQEIAVFVLHHLDLTAQVCGAERIAVEGECQSLLLIADPKIGGTVAVTGSGQLSGPLDGNARQQEFHDFPIQRQQDGEPVNPDYDPSSPMFFDNGDFLIFAPPDLSVALFLDTAYDKEVYDQKIVESYAADGDGRGDVISRDDIPVLMGGALPFTNMQNLLSENHDDGTYRYEDITEDGQLLVVNTAEQSCFVPDVQELDDYLTACALSLSDAGTYELLSAEEHEEYSKNLSYPVYIVTYTAGENEDTREWTVFVMDTDICTYLYGFCAPPDAAADMGETYQNIFSQLYLSDEE